MIPKEQLTAYQRWEMASFDEAPSPDRSAPTIDNAELTLIREQARREAYAKGLAEGYQTGHNEGLIAGAKEGQDQANELIRQLSSLINNFNNELTQADGFIAADLLDLALNIAQAMIKTALPLHPEWVLPIIHEAIRDLPTLQRNAKLILNPADAVLVRLHMQDDLSKNGWSIVEDYQIEAGGCRIETGCNQIDATLGKRWQRLAAALGQDSSWLKHDDPAPA